MPRSSAPARPLLRWRRLSANAVIPSYQTGGAAGLDVCACLDDAVELSPGAIAVIPCGFAVAVPEGFEAQVRPRSGLASRHGITLPNAPGTIDADYRGEVKVPLINLGPAVFRIEPGMRVAQLVVAPVARVEIIETDELDETARGGGGFGSTGV